MLRQTEEKKNICKNEPNTTPTLTTIPHSDLQHHHFQLLLSKLQKPTNINKCKQTSILNKIKKMKHIIDYTNQLCGTKSAYN